MSQNLGFAFQKLAFTLLRRSDELLQSKFQLGYAQYKLLEVLAEQPNISQREVAAALYQSEASVSRQIKLMQKEGLLRVGTPPGNRRVRVIALSSQGSEVHAQATYMLNRLFAPLLARLSPEQQKVFGEVLFVLSQGAGKR